MNHTTNYQLPQWEQTDRVTREDVNDAMSAIDAAIADAAPAENAMQYVRVAYRKTTAAAASVSLDVSGVDWSQYLRLDLFILPGGAVNIELGLNGMTTNHCVVGTGTGSNSSTYPYLCQIPSSTAPNAWISFLPPQPKAQVACVKYSITAYGNGGNWSSTVGSSALVTWETLTSIDLNGSSNVPAKTEILLCGLKK